MILSLKNNSTKCNIINNQKERELARYSFMSYSLPTTSILIQEKRNIDFILFHLPDNSSTHGILNPCEIREHNRLIFPYDDTFYSIIVSQPENPNFINLNQIKEAIPSTQIPILGNNDLSTVKLIDIYRSGQLASKPYNFKKNKTYIITVKAKSNLKTIVNFSLFIKDHNSFHILGSRNLKENLYSYKFKYKSTYNQLSKIIYEDNSLNIHNFIPTSKISFLRIQEIN